MKVCVCILLFLVVIAVLPVSTASAGIITQVNLPATDFHWLSAITTNNDGPGAAFQNQVTWDVTLDSALNYVDIVIDVSDSGGTTEYFVNTDVHLPVSAVGGNWDRFELQIVGDNLPVGLNFDTDDGDFVHGRLLLTKMPDSVNDHVLVWNDVELSVFVPQIFHEIDIPDSNPSGGGGYSFTLRYYPVVPEPTTAAISFGAFALWDVRRRRYRFSNHR